MTKNHPRRSNTPRISVRDTQIREIRRELSYLDPIHRVIVQQLTRAHASDDEENFQRLGLIYNPLMTRKLYLTRMITELEEA